MIFLQLISREESTRWFGKVLPRLANLLLRFPSLLQSHYQNADNLLDGGNCSIKTGLRLLGPQEPGIVFLSQVSSIIRIFLNPVFSPILFHFHERQE